MSAPSASSISTEPERRNTTSDEIEYRLMPYDLTPHLRPAQAALLVFECQEGLIGEHSHLPTLAASARTGNMVENIAALLAAARSANAHVLYCKVAKRSDGTGDPVQTPLQIRLRETVPDAPAGPDMGEIVDALEPRKGEIVVARQHGMTGFHDSGLDSLLRNTGVRTIVLVGVSVNIGILGTAIEAVNRGYTVVVPTDCVAGDPPEYAEQALRYSVRNLAFLSTRREIESTWSKAT